MKGRKPKTPAEHRMNGTYKPGRHAALEAAPSGDFAETLAMPKGLPKNVQAVWKRFISAATWLDGSREPTALVFAHLYAEFLDDPRAFNAARLAQMRSLLADLGLSEPRNREDISPAARKELNRVVEHHDDPFMRSHGCTEEEAWDRFMASRPEGRA